MSSLQLPITDPDNFSFQACLSFLDRGYDDVELAVGEDYADTLLRGPKGLAYVRVRQEGKFVRVDILAGNTETENVAFVEQYVRDWWDLDRDLTAFIEIVKIDPSLWDLFTPFRGLRLMGMPHLLGALSWSIIGQQINLSFAFRLKKRLLETYGESLSSEDHRLYTYPEASRLAAIPIEDLRLLQFSQRKAEYLTGIARLVHEGTLGWEKLAKMDSHAERREELLKIRGVGEWTAQYVLMKSFKALEAIPYGDAGLHQAFKKILNRQENPSASELKEFLDDFHPWQAYVVFYLWRSLVSDKNA